MQLVGKQRGEPSRPFDTLVVEGNDGQEIAILDGAGRVYASGTGRVEFAVSGALGTHQAFARDTGETILFPVVAETAIRDDNRRFHELLRLLEHTMVSDGEQDCAVLDGKIYRYFVRWLRDHVHTLKGMKYFADHLREGIDLYRISQREDGMIWDNVYPRDGKNYWDMRFSEGDFIRPFPDGTAEFKRIPVENDVEYLYVEGIYYTWKATGDDAWMADCLDSALAALEYSITDPYRWSTEFNLLKRGYTIDTWDFQNEFDRLEHGDIMRVDPERTRFGVMFGDNTGYAAACRQMGEMLRHAGRADEAALIEARGREILERLDKLAWRGTHYRHHVNEHPEYPRPFGVDENAQISLSNAYSLNRGIDPEKATAIVASYKRLRDDLPEGSPGEWYTIYPPFEAGFGGHSGKWQYMNASVTPIVAGELARGAFELGEEAYGVDILLRLLELGRKHGNHFHCAYTGAMPAPAPRTFHRVDLQPFANCGLTDGDAPSWGSGANDLREFPTGAGEFAGVPFEVAPSPRAMLGLGVREGLARSISVPVGAKAGALHLLHACSGTGASGLAGTLRLRYAGGQERTLAIVNGQHLSGWWFPRGKHASGRWLYKVGWTGANPECIEVGVCVVSLANPEPELEIVEASFEATEDGAAWGVLGFTLSEEPYEPEPHPISFGIPDNWGAAAVVYALVEGLAGVVDADTAFRRVRLSPRWSAAETTHASVCIHYPDSNAYVAYLFLREPDSIKLLVTGSGERADLHLLVPGAPKAVTLDREPVEYQLERVGESIYVDLSVDLQPRALVEVTF